MKTYFICCLAAISFLVISCKKDIGSNDDTGLSQDIKNFVPQSVIDSMRNWGLKINEGKKPPLIDGIYNISPNLCTFDNSGNNRAGSIFGDYRYRFRNQNNEQLTISLDYKELTGLDSAVAVGSFLSGSDSYFTVFVNAAGIQYGISYKQIAFYSGKKTTTGISEYQHGFYFVEKGPDPNNKLVKPGTSRIFNDKDKVSEINAVYRQSHNLSSLGSR